MLVILHYHEIALKGRNRPFFVDKLAQNARRATADLAGARVTSLSGRLLVELDDTNSWTVVRERLGSVLGVANFSPAHAAPRDVDGLCEAVTAVVRGRDLGTFRVLTKRNDKTFPLVSSEVDRRVGAAVQAVTGAPVNLGRPDTTIHVEVLRDRIFFALDRERGPGGFPVGSSGRVIALLSGGIDSPVAAYRMMKRGCRCILIHFHAFPLLDRSTIVKAQALSRSLARFQHESRLLLVPFGAVQQAIVAACPTPLRVVLYRRFMLRIAEAAAQRQRAKGIVTGESLGQVASQTLDNMSVIGSVATRFPLLRPLVGMDKEEIIGEAQRIGTFGISTQPDMDCCQLFVPRHPATAARREEVLRAEERLDVAGLVSAALDGIEVERYGATWRETPPEPLKEDEDARALGPR
jgi:thiamine biosynthesis protein ThiI